MSGRAEKYTKECGWNESQFKPGIPEYDAMFDPACGYLRRGKNNNAMKLLKKAKVNGTRDISHRKLRQISQRSNMVSSDVLNNPFKDEARQYLRNHREEERMKREAATKGARSQGYKMSHTSPAFSSVAAAFDFDHHDGTDPGLELEVLKVILIREGLLGKLWDFAERANLKDDEASMGTLEGSVVGDYSSKMKDSSGVSILHVLTQCRDVTAKVCMAVEAWRKGSGAAGMVGSAPKPFMWHGENYLLKCCNDIDFLAVCDSLVSALKVPADKMRRNPLMLPNTLDEQPEEVTASLGEGLIERDIDNAIEDSKKRSERRGLRMAEHILLLEENFRKASMPPERGGNQDEDDYYQDDDYEDEEEEDAGGEGMFMGGDTNSYMTEQSENYEGELMSWYDKAQAQLLALSQPISGYSKFKSRQLGDEAIEKKEHIAAAANFQTVPENHYPAPRRLTEILQPNVTPDLLMSMERAKADAGRRPTITLSVPDRTDFGEGTYTPGAVPPPVSLTADRATVIQNARRKSSLMPKGPQGVQSRLGLSGRVKGEIDEEPAGLRTREGGEGGKNVIKRIKKKRSRPPQGLGGVVPPKKTGTGKVYTAGELAASLTTGDLRAIKKIENPKPEMALVGAAVLIMMSSGKAVPKDVGWGAFKKEVGDKNFVTRLLTLDGTEVTGFKARALKGFLQNNKFIPAKIAKVSVGCGKLAAWSFVVLSGVSEFEWPEGLDLSQVLEGMEEFVEKSAKGGKKKGGKTIEEEKKEEKKVEEKKKITKRVPKKVPKTRKPKDVDKQMYSGTRVMNGHTLFVTVFDTVSKTQAFVKAYDPNNSQEYTLTVAVPGSLNSLSQIRNWAGKTLVEGITFVPQRLSREAHLEYEKGRKEGKSVEVSTRVAVEEKKKPVVKKEAVEEKKDEAKEPVVVAEEKKEEPVVEEKNYEDDGFEDGEDDEKPVEFEEDFEEDFEENVGMDENEAATKLQGRARMRKAKKRVEGIKEDKAAVKLQGRVRIKKAKKVIGEKREQSNAAVKLQGRVRIKKAKKRVDKLKKERTESEVVEEEEEEEEDYDDDEDYEEEFEAESPGKKSPEKRPLTAESDDYGEDDYEEEFDED